MDSRFRYWVRKNSVFINLALAVFTAALFFVAFFSLCNQSKYYKATTRPFVNISFEVPSIMEKVFF